jgi:phage terminase large subunit-like protein
MIREAVFHDDTPRQIVVRAPKGHAKSTVIGKVIPLWLICCINRDIRGITACVNTELAERFTVSIERELTHNELLQADFGPFYSSGNVWTKAEFTVIRQSRSPSPTWRAVGSQKSIQGGRADVIIPDDAVDIMNTATQQQRDKFAEWFDGDLLGNLEPGGRVFMVGTSKHHDDQYHRLARNPRWTSKVWDAIVNEEQRQALWPERWSWDALMAKRESIGRLSFMRDYRNVCVTSESSPFRLEDLENARRSDLTFATACDVGSVVAGIDLGIIEDARAAQAADSDYTVPSVWQVHDGRWRLLWLERFRGMGLHEQAQRLALRLRGYVALKVVTVESNQAQRWMASELLRSDLADLPIRRHSTSRTKADPYEGVPALSALFEAGKVDLPYGDERSREATDILIGELFGLGVERHDDTVMSFYMATIGARQILSQHVTFTSITTRAKEKDFLSAP